MANNVLFIGGHKDGTATQVHTPVPYHHFAVFTSPDQPPEQVIYHIEWDDCGDGYCGVGVLLQNGARNGVICSEYINKVRRIAELEAELSRARGMLSRVGRGSDN